MVRSKFLLLLLCLPLLLIAADAPPGTLQIALVPNVALADIYVDGVLVASQVQSASLPVTEGSHSVEARNVFNGFARTQTTTVFSGWTRHLNLDLSTPADSLVVRTSYTWRFGIGVPDSNTQAPWVSRLGSGWWYDWRVRPNLGGALGEYWQMIRLGNCTLNPTVDVFTAEARRRPGQTWIIGNEPDVAEQDNITPECLADLYHDAYTALKSADPTAKVAIGGVVQASPLRLKYLDRALARYKSQYNAPMPVDIWTMHAYILREDPANWGAGVPVGLTDVAGWLIQPDEHDSLTTFQQEIKDFRQWMAANNYRDRPLVITEYGILLPADIGFTPERVQKFMVGTFDYLVTASDPALGLPSDNNHLVQRWAWFSMSYDQFPTSNLYDPTRQTFTPLGQSFRDYINRLK
jgi:Glycosyl hydrolase catalytic core